MKSEMTSQIFFLKKIITRQAVDDDTSENFKWRGTRGAIIFFPLNKHYKI